ncbi:protein CTR9 [Tanacetum coccineum]
MLSCSLGQVQLKLGDFKSSLSNFEKAFLDLGELLISTDSRAALEAFKTVHNLLKKSNEEVSVELLNNIGVLHFEKGEFELFQDIEKAGVAVELPRDKITTLSNLARLFEQLHKTETASLELELHRRMRSEKRAPSPGRASSEYVCCQCACCLQKMSNLMTRKETFTQVQEAASGSVFVQIPDVRATVAELKNAVRLFSQLSGATNLQIHGFDEKKIETHVGFHQHLLEAAKIHGDAAAEAEDQQNKHRLELARQAAIREEESRLAEEQKKVKLDKRKQEDIEEGCQHEQHLERIKVSGAQMKIGRVVGLSEKTGLKEMMRRADRVKRGKEKFQASYSLQCSEEKIGGHDLTLCDYTSNNSSQLESEFLRKLLCGVVALAWGTRSVFSEWQPCSHSFKEAVIGPKEHVHPQVKNIVIKEDGYIRSRLEGCWMGKAKNFQVLQNAWTILENNGLTECNDKYCGGLSFLLEWNSRETASKSLEANKIWSACLTSRNHVRRAEMTTGKLTWLKYKSLPS